MKHRSVIAFVIVAAALFSLPRLSHDLLALKGAVGTALHRELLHAFLNLPAGEPSAAAPVARTAQSLLASCPQAKSGAKAARAAAPGRAEVRTGGRGLGEGAMIGDPSKDPISQRAGAEIEDAVERAVESLHEVEAEIAMITPPNNGIEPPRAAERFAAAGGARVEADRLRVEAEGLRVAYATAPRLEVNGPEWQRAFEDAARVFKGAAPGTYEFRVVRDGAKTKVLKFKCGECPTTAPRLTRLPRQVAVNIPLPEPAEPVGTIGE